MKVLLDLNCHPDAKTSADAKGKEWTALHKATKDSNIELIELLISRGANPQMTWNNQTAIDLAPSDAVKTAITALAMPAGSGMAPEVPAAVPSSDAGTEESVVSLETAAAGAAAADIKAEATPGEPEAKENGEEEAAAPMDAEAPAADAPPQAAAASTIPPE